MRGKNQDFPSKIFRLTVLKNFAGEPNPSVLCFGKFLVANKFMEKKMEVSRFSVYIFCLTVSRKLVVEPFSVSLNSDIGKFYASEG